MNLRKETLDVLAKYHYNKDDILSIQNEYVRFSAEEFFKIADIIEYDAGFGSVEINPDLVIVMRDGSWFSRAEYDGSEWWRYNKCPYVLSENPTNKINKDNLIVKHFW